MPQPEGREAAAVRQPPAALRAPTAALESATQPAAAALAASQPLSICSFNIQFLGQSTKRDHQALADLVAEYDIVVVQELVAPPYAGTFPDGTPFKPDLEARAFFDAMQAHGFVYVLSEEDTGTGPAIHVNSTATEWWVAFYKPQRVELANDLPGGFLGVDRSDNPDYERVPYGFAFRHSGVGTDFVLISVHLQPGGNVADAVRRQHELASIVRWITVAEAMNTERDYIILGDMNIKNAQELTIATPPGFVSLNDECRATNTNVNGPKPYDHVMYRPAHTSEIDTSFDMVVVDLIEAMRPTWSASDPYPGDPYVHNQFRQYFSDHHPIVFRFNLSAADDD